MKDFNKVKLTKDQLTEEYGMLEKELLSIKRSKKSSKKNGNMVETP